MISIQSPTVEILNEVLADTSNAFLCTAFFSKGGISFIERSLQKAKTIELWLPLNVAHWVSGHADFDALALALRSLSKTDTKISIRSKSTIHAKLYYARDKRAALLTSANLTRSAFSSNIELAALLSGDPCQDIDNWIQGQYPRIPEISLNDLLDCIDITSDAVKNAAGQLQASDPIDMPEYNTAVDLFEEELVPKLAHPRVAAIAEEGGPSATIRPGTKITPTSKEIATRLPQGWPSYSDFIQYLRDLKSPEATELAERADGKSNLSGHVKHFFWTTIFFFIEEPKIAEQIDPLLAEIKIVHWQELPWVKRWQAFLDRHDDEYYPELKISFHTAKVYLPPILGGATLAGGAGSGNFKRTIGLLAKFFQDHDL